MSHELEIKLNGGGIEDRFLLIDDQNRLIEFRITIKNNRKQSIHKVDLALVDLTGNRHKRDASFNEIQAGATEHLDFGLNANDIQSAKKEDTTLEVQYRESAFENESETPPIVIKFPITVVKNPCIWFEGRFQARFATEVDPYNHPTGNPSGNPNGGWTWALEGEEPFCPKDSKQSVPSSLQDKGVGRVIRFHNAQSPRPYVPPIGVYVTGIQGYLKPGDKPLPSAFFFGDDTLVGWPVRLGKDTYFAVNRKISDEDKANGAFPEERYTAGLQPLANFELSIGPEEAFIKGRSRVGPRPIEKKTVPSTTPRDDADSRPKGQGSYDEIRCCLRSRLGITSLRSFAEGRLKTLAQALEGRVSRGETETVEFRNLQTRMNFLLPTVASKVSTEMIRAFRRLGVTLKPYPREQASAETAAWNAAGVFKGYVDEDVTIRTPHPVSRSILNYFRKICPTSTNSDGSTPNEDLSLEFKATFFNFHSDELCGRVAGSLQPKGNPAAKFKDYVETKYPPKPKCEECGRESQL